MKSNLTMKLSWLSSAHSRPTSTNNKLQLIFHEVKVGLPRRIVEKNTWGVQRRTSKAELDPSLRVLLAQARNVSGDSPLSTYVVTISQTLNFGIIQ
jgi:hypothetical protein